MEKRYWFPAKRYGWGWGIPCAWQGWVVLALFMGLLLAGAWLFPPKKGPALYIGYAAGLSLGLVAICWWKGERPRWRWDDDDPKDGE